MRRFDISRSLLLVAILAAATTAGIAAETAPDRVDEPADRDVDLMADDPLFDEDDDFLAEFASRDPFEGANRNVFGFNRRVDVWLFDPITRGYRRVVPEAGRRAIYRASLNLDAPVELANHMLQFRVVEAAGTATRFVINTTFGIAGLFDPAADVLEVHRVDADFGQTLARYGAPSGPYLMLPIFGPSTVRDVSGDVVDILADPLTYFLGPFQWWTLALGGSEGLIVREASFDDLQLLEEGSIDFYAALRSAYLQTRDAKVLEATGTSERADIVMRGPD
jgi:phospholipid-binding lipoprotein MlaA